MRNADKVNAIAAGTAKLPIAWSRSGKVPGKTLIPAHELLTTVVSSSYRLSSYGLWEVRQKFTPSALVVCARNNPSRGLVIAPIPAKLGWCEKPCSSSGSPLILAFFPLQSNTRAAVVRLSSSSPTRAVSM